MVAADENGRLAGDRWCSALRSFEDLLGITTGGDDGRGHHGYAAAPGLQPFGPDVVNRR